MTLQNSLFPFILILLLITDSHPLASIGTCLAHCATCQPNNLSACKGSRPCQWGFYDAKSNGNCEILPTLRMLSQELGERNDKAVKISTETWGQQAKYSTCQYNFHGKKRVIDIVGLFGEISTISKTFTVTPNQQIYELSFNLIRDEWMPFSDFLMIDIFSGDLPLQSIEISYESRIKMDSQSLAISCSGKKVINEKYNIKVQNVKREIGTSLTFVFTGFLSRSSWGLSNIKLLEGCHAFTQYDYKRQACSKCDTDSYLLQDAKGTLLCERCPNFCKTCISKTECTSCFSNFKLTGGKCLFSNENKLQWISLSEDVVSCGSNSFLMGSLGKSVIIPEVRSQDDNLYNQIQIGFKFYYNPEQWSSKNDDRIKMKVNQAEVFTINRKNFTNTATDLCSTFKGGRIAVINIVSPAIMQVSNKLRIQFELVGKNNISFGVQDVFIKSYTKVLPSPQSSPINNPPQNNDTVPTITPTVAPVSSTPTTPITPSVPVQAPIQTLTPPPSPPPQTQPIVPEQSSQPSQVQSVMPVFSSSQNNSSTPLSNFNRQNNMTFIPTTCPSNSGLQLTVFNIAQIKGYISVSIDKLPQDSYQLDSFIIDDKTLHACLAISQSFTNAVITLYDNPKSSNRLLQSGNPIARASVSRFDYISPAQRSRISQFSVFFSVFAWFGVIGMIIAVMIGYGVTMEEYIISLQILFLHLYICTQILPLSFRETVAGLRRVQNLNFFVPQHARNIESDWMGNVIQNGPVRLSLYNTDINFSRQFYPIIIINIVYFIWFCLIFTTKKYLLSRLALKGQKTIVERVIDNIADRVVNFADQIWRYQFMVTVWFCFLQFHNLSYPSYSNRNQTINAIFCISCFICTLAWPLLVGYHCHKQYYENEYSFFIYRFEDIYYRRIPQFYLPTSHHRVGYPLFKICRLFLIPCLIALVQNSGFVLVSLIIIQIGQILYAYNYQIYNDAKYWKMKIAENVLFAVIEVVLLVLYSIKNMADSDTFLGCGFFLAALSVLVVLNSIIRTGYLSFNKYSQIKGIVFEEMVDPDHKKLKTERVV